MFSTTRRAAVIALASLVASVGMLALMGMSSTASAATSPPVYDLPGWAVYYNLGVVSQASTTLVVPEISCRENPAGSFVGQADGIDLLGDYNNSDIDGAALVQTYCVGKAPTYDTEFFVPPTPNPDATAMGSPAWVAVRPGDLVAINVQLTAETSTVSIDNLSTGQHARLSGGVVPDAGPDIGMIALQGDASGPTSFGNPAPPITITPPAPSTPVAFFDSQVDGQPLSWLAGLAADDWTNPSDSSQVLAGPSPIVGLGPLSSFVVTTSPSGGFYGGPFDHRFGGRPFGIGF